ncbi:MAG: pentapeptide repeat-containing protein [Chitinophagales bacterium]|nr:pentapeptide repeat-containing protein [Chitinophagales bacterium]
MIKKVFFLHALLLCILMNSIAQKSVAQWLALAKKGEKNLVNADLAGADLSKLDLHGVNLSGANLSGANLSSSKLYDCNLSNANLSGANLSKADLFAAKMQYANLQKANLTQALLQEAVLQFADLTEANLQTANLLLTDLKGSNLQGANVTNAIFDYAQTSSITAQVNSAPEMVETEALGNALTLLERNINVFVRMSGAKINKNTKGVNFVWAKKNGAVIVAAN